ncbi:SAPS-domain-containing protein [Tothia fuscella]|uniref:SAPS-domain-containing protein n=1 Tax=Tothia fuscella TaxID=1048955 RepID=A0A9P4NIM4_9PEZI|nr:SAPS-domain-containing protein [Tothia fuscella]
MFWRFGGYANISTLDTILDKPDVTVEELLDESDLIQELKQQNSKLLEFLRDDNVLERLLKYITAPKVEDAEEEPQSPPEAEGSGGNPLNSLFGKKRRERSRSNTVERSEGEEESKEEKQRMKYAYVSCEVLSSDVWSIAEALLDHREALRTFWQYLSRPAPLDPVQAGYFTKVLESLFDKKTEEAIDIMKSIDNVVADMLKHVDCPTVMDLLLKIISLERSEGGQGIVDWLQTQNLIPLLLAHLSPEHEAATQTSAGDFLKAIITISANATAQDTNVIGPNELTRQLVSEECIEILINDMLRGGNPLTVGVGIVIEVIRKNNSDYDLDNQIGPVPKSSDPIYLGTLLREFAKNVPKFMELITHAKQKKELKVAFGDKIEPLGFDRFKTCELMAELLHCSNMALLNERGSEAEVKRRDAERDRLKAEGKLIPAKESNPADDFGTSVDSQGFHHARAPSTSSDSPEEIRRLEVSNGAEDEFENVTASEAQADDTKDDFDEKDELLGEPLEQSPKVEPRQIPEKSDDLEPAPLSPRKGALSPAHSRSGSKTKLETVSSTDADSPTSAGVTDRLNSVLLGKNKDEEMADSSPKESGESKTTSDNIQLLSPHPDDRPAPLFAKKRPQSPVKGENPPETISSLESAATDSADQAEKGEDLTAEPPEHEEEEEIPPYEVDLGGAPVVGDLLKMMFVEHHVVPTILDFFFRFPWNNFLHNVVYDVVQQVFNGQMNRGFNRSLAIDLFETGRITERIIEGQRASDKAQADSRMRLGYMGHLTLIAEEVVKFSERHSPELLSQAVVDKVSNNPQWSDYVNETLAETRERDNAILGGVRPDLSVGPRQAVLNAVNAAQGYGNNNNNNNSVLAGLTSNSDALGPDTPNLNTTTSSGGYLFSGSSLLSGFNHGSSDEEDEEMGEEGESQRVSTTPLDDSDQVGELSFEDVDMDYR